MKFTGSVIGKIFLVLLCIILGMVIALGGIVGGLYFVLTKATVGQVEEKVGGMLPEGVELDFSDEIKNKTVLEWGKEFLAAISDMSVTTVGQLEGLVGYPVISNALYETVGVEASAVKDSTFSDLGATISNSLTVEKVGEKFDVAFPDMPLFTDREFLSTPLADAFENLSQRQLNQFVVIDENESNAVLVAIQDLTIDELGGEALTDKINGLKLSDVIEIDENESNSVLIALKDTKIGELGGEEADGIINALFIGEIMNIDENSEKILQSMKYASIESVTVKLDKASYDLQNEEFRLSAAYADAAGLEKEGYEYIYASDGTAYVHVIENGEKVFDAETGTYLCYETKLSGEGAERKNYPLIGINDTVKTSKIGDIIEVTEDDKLMWSLKDSTLGSISEDVKKLFLDEVMNITEESSKTLVALKYASLETITVTASGAEFIDYGEPEKELEGYVYRYLSDGKGGYVPYVAKIGENGTIETTPDGNYVLIATKEYDGFYRPLSSVDDRVKELFVGELIGETATQTMKSLSESSLESALAYIDITALDESTEIYKETNPDYASYEKEGYIYKYSALGLAYVCVEDEKGSAVTEGGKYKLYETRLYNGKYIPLIGLDDKMKTITFGEVVEIDENDPNTTPLMRSLKNTRVEEMDETVNKLFMDEMIDITESSAPVLQSIEYAALRDRKTAVNKAEADGTVPGAEYIARQLDGYLYVYVTDSDGTPIPYVCITENGIPVTITIEGEEYYEVYETKYYDGYDRPIIGLNTRLDTLALGDIFTEEEMSEGVLSLLSADTSIKEISGEMATKIKDSSLAKLAGIGVIDASGEKFDMTKTPKEQRAFIWNSNLNGMIEGIIGFVDEPIVIEEGVPKANYALIADPTVTLAGGTYNSIAEFVAAYQGENFASRTVQEYLTIILGGNITVNVNPETDAAFLAEDGNYYIPVFNLDGADYTLTFAGGTVVLAATESGASEVSKHQFYYAFDASNGGNGSGLNYYDGTGSVSASDNGSFFEFKKIN